MTSVFGVYVCVCVCVRMCVRLFLGASCLLFKRLFISFLGLLSLLLCTDRCLCVDLHVGVCPNHRCSSRQ